MEQRTRRWVRELGMVRSETAGTHFDAIGSGRLVGWVYPYALPEHRELVADWFSWLFILDDQCDEGFLGRSPAMLDSVLEPMRYAIDDVVDKSTLGSDGGPAANPLAAGLADVCRRTRPVVPDQWRVRFFRHVHEYLNACRREAENRAAHRVPELAEYPPNRRAAGAMELALDFIELTAGFYLPSSMYREQVYQAARAAAADVVCWTDDLATVAKERLRGDVHNLVIVLARHNQCSLQDAHGQALAMLMNRLQTFFEAERQLLGRRRRSHHSNRGHRALRHNLSGLRIWMRGHLDWGLETARYRDLDITDGIPSYIDDFSF